MKKFTFIFFAALFAAAGWAQTLNESFEGTYQPAGWNTYGTAFQKVSTNKVTGIYSIYAPCSSTFKTYGLVMPQITVASGIVLGFKMTTDAWFGESAYYTTVMVKVSTTNNQQTSFTTIKEFSTFAYSGIHSNRVILSKTDLENVWYEAVTDLSDYSGQNIYIAIELYDHNGSSIWIDDVFVNGSSCPRPTSLGANNITVGSANISWTAIGSETSWKLSYKKQSETVFTDTIVTNNSCLLSNLDANTDYDIQVKAICTGEESSAAVSTFKTLCGIISTFPWTESFEGAYPPACWNTYGSEYEKVYTKAATGTYSIYAPSLYSIRTYGLATPKLAIASGSEFSFKMTTDYRYGSSSYYTTVRVKVSTTDNQQASFITIKEFSTYAYSGIHSNNVILSNSDIENVWFEAVTDLTAYSGQNIYIAIEVYDHSGSNIWIDDVKIEAGVTLCNQNDKITYTIVSYDAVGDGWSSASSLIIKQNGKVVATVKNQNLDYTINVGEYNTHTVKLCPCAPFEAVWVRTGTNNFDYECSFVIKDNNNDVVFATPAAQKETSVISGCAGYANNQVVFSGMVNCINPLCPSPKGININNITHNSAAISWTAGSSETSWKLFYKKQSETNFSNETIINTTPTYNLQNLDANTTYDIHIKAICNNDEESGAAVSAFKTLRCDNMVNYVIVSYDARGDGWNGAYLTVKQNGIVVATIENKNLDGSIGSAEQNTHFVSLCPCEPFELIWTKGTSYDYECSFVVRNNNDVIIFATPAGQTSPSTTAGCAGYYNTQVVFSGTTCPPTPPTVTTLPANPVGQTTATLHKTVTQGTETMTAQGFKYKKTSETAWQTSADGNLTNLTPNTEYQFYAYTTTATDTYNGSTLIFTTLPTVVLPVADFTFETNELSVTFTDVSIGEPTIWVWNLGDGATSTYQNPVHTYTAAGTYNVTLVVINAQGASEPVTKQVSVANTGFDDIFANKITLYPNPAKDELFIINNEKLTINNVEILDIAGKKILTPHSSFLIPINISLLPQGIYFIKIQFENSKIVFEKFIKE